MGQAFDHARQAHEQMRATEGAAMLLDLRERVRLIREQHSVVEQLREQTIPQHRKRIEQHLRQLSLILYKDFPVLTMQRIWNNNASQKRDRD